MSPEYEVGWKWGESIHRNVCVWITANIFTHRIPHYHWIKFAWFICAVNLACLPLPNANLLYLLTAVLIQFRGFVYDNLTCTSSHFSATYLLLRGNMTALRYNFAIHEAVYIHHAVRYILHPSNPEIRIYSKTQYQ